MVNIVETLQPNSSLESKYIQSANTLFHFTDQREYLENMLEARRLSPRYVIEDMKYLDFPMFEESAIPMTCFCDIKLHSIIEHTSFYGEFGIGFKKELLIQKGIQPIHYLNENSPFTKDFKEELKSLLDETLKIPEMNQDYILKKLFYTKPIQGEMWDKRIGKNINKIFHDENEWRYVPENIQKYKFKPIIPVGKHEPIQDRVYRNKLNKVLFEHEELSLNFEFKDIRYLFVRNEDECSKLIQFIFNKLDVSNIDKGNLIAKIQVVENIKEDY